MKKLKKVFLICLFSFLFIVNVNASTIELDNSLVEGLYDSFFTQKTNFNKESIENLCDTFLSQYMSGDYYYYTCSFQVVSSTAGWFSYNGDKYTPQIVINQFSKDVILGYNIGYNWFNIENYSDSVGKSRKIWLNSNLSVKQADSLNSSLQNTSFSYSTSKIVPVNFPLFYVVKSNLTNQYLTHYYSSTYKDSIKMGDLYIGYDYRNTNVNFSDLHPKSFSKIFPSEKLNYIGTFNNSNVITYKIKDEEVGTNKELKIKFTFLNQLDVNANDIEIYKYGSQVLTQHSGLTCENSEIDTICEFNLKYDVYDSVDDKLFFDFKFNDYYNLIVEDSSGSNGIYNNYKNIEFEYKQLNFKEISGAIFYLRNYDNFKYLSSYFAKDFFKFIIMSDFDLLGRDVIYPNDIEYKNNYIYNDENNITQIDKSNLNKLNNFSREEIVYVFDENLLSENKYSSFLILNRNYLGSLDKDNKNLYVYYNSTLFNINKLKYSVLVNNGTTNNYVSTENDFNFSVNGSQSSIGGGINSGFIFEFDEEIKVQYKRGLEYFKDKIIDMFEFVSEFYNTMPNKFQVAFSLIFVLLIGIALFRLLL